MNELKQYRLVNDEKTIVYWTGEANSYTEAYKKALKEMGGWPDDTQTYMELYDEA